MDTSVLKNFAQESRRYLMDVVKKKIDYYLTTDNADIRAKQSLIDDLKKEITNTSKDQVIEKIAYAWFNRFCALRYMDVKQYSLVGVLTPASAEHTQPEILMEAKSGHIKEELGRKENRDQVIALLSGKVSSSDPQSDAYKLLLLMACNYYHSIMPFLFEKVDDYTELLMPDDLLSESSIISKTREALNIDNCENVEVIGWLYQFYISEKKDEVFAGLKNNKKITPENIPAATQLFTPNWIVRYLVENSLGRLWMLNRPNSNLISKMEYYIKPDSVGTDFLKVNGPEEIKICDPACGSGHMLVYAFDLLYLMYEEVGIDPNEIPSLILKNNLFGVEIDKRAGELAAFALTMKAREKQRRYFRSPVQPNICVLENVHFDSNEIKEYMDYIGRDLFTESFQNTLSQFEDAKNFGSLIKPELTDIDNILSLLDKKNVLGNLFLTYTHAKVLKVLFQTKILSPTYHVVVANPPYMGAKGMNANLASWLKKNYNGSNSDLFSAFIFRCCDLTIDKGHLGFMTPFVWMYLTTYKNLRQYLLGSTSIVSLVKPSYTSFFQSAIVPVCAFNLVKKRQEPKKQSSFFDLGYLGNAEEQPIRFKLGLNGDQKYQPYQRVQSDFEKIPGCPIAFNLPDKIFNLFEESRMLENYASIITKGIFTGNNDKFLRYWFEISFDSISSGKWKQYNKAGGFRKWYGLAGHVIDWRNDGESLSSFEGAGLSARKHFGKDHIVWSKLTSGDSSFRYDENSNWYDDASPAVIEPRNYFGILGMLNSSATRLFLKSFNPTLNLQPGDVAKLPMVDDNILEKSESIVRNLVMLSKTDWNSSETSLEFMKLLFFDDRILASDIKSTFLNFKNYCNDITNRMINLEQQNNEIFISGFGLSGLIQSDVASQEISLFNNPHFVFGGEQSEKDLEYNFSSKALREFISYSVGCMFGRYSLDKDGLILANQGETIKDYLKQIPKPTFAPDEGNVIPLLDGDWFADEISERFKKFLKVSFGENNFEVNLKFLEAAIGKDIKKYFTKDFYNDHVKMYKKRPIYWMFSSPNGTFNALIYMHRYTPDTVSIVLNSYLREFRTKLSSKRENLERLSNDASASARDKASAVKEIEQLKKMIVELNEYEKDILYPLATQRLEINLDDGVKVNYPKFGKALKTIKGLDKDED